MEIVCFCAGRHDGGSIIRLQVVQQINITSQIYNTNDIEIGKQTTRERERERERERDRERKRSDLHFEETICQVEHHRIIKKHRTIKNHCRGVGRRDRVATFI